jgi:hypothetical protein
MMNRVKSLVLIGVLLCDRSLLRAQDTAGVGAITGTVTSHDAAPAAGVRVCALTTTRCVVTNERGKFRLTEIRVGEYQLEISAPNLPPFTSASISVRAGLEAHIEMALPALDAVQESVKVSGSVVVPPEEVKTSSFLVERREIFKAAGAQMDVSRYVQSLPGVGVGSSSMRNDLIVRGGSPLENLFIVDNIEIPNINTSAASTVFTLPRSSKPQTTIRKASTSITAENVLRPGSTGSICSASAASASLGSAIPKLASTRPRRMCNAPAFPLPIRPCSTVKTVMRARRR